MGHWEVCIELGYDFWDCLGSCGFGGGGCGGTRVPDVCNKSFRNKDSSNAAPFQGNSVRSGVHSDNIRKCSERGWKQEKQAPFPFEFLMALMFPQLISSDYLACLSHNPPGVGFVPRLLVIVSGVDNYVLWLLLLVLQSSKLFISRAQIDRNEKKLCMPHLNYSSKHCTSKTNIMVKFHEGTLFSYATN